MPDPISRLNAALSGRYHIERELGAGGMATVYLARDEKHNRHVALKVLKPELAAVVGAERFLAEIETTANLQHPHILPLFDSGEADGFLFYVMPYVEGETLRDRLERDKQLPVDEAVRIASDVAEALHAAHEQGVVHRDIKPANILLSRGRPLVADFGIALAVSAAGGGRLTETGLSMGTPYYMSPEQASADREASAASDVYSLGCVLYEMLTGEPPHTGSTAQAVLAKILMDDAPAPTRARPSIPVNVDAAIRKAIEKLPADRFAGAQAFANALADPAFRYGEPALAVGGARAQLTPLAMATSAVAVIFGAVAGWAVLRQTPEPVRRVERFAVPFLEGQEHAGYPGANGSDLSPDGSMLVYRFNGPQGQIIMVRRWDDLTATAVRASTGGTSPAVSFDGLELAFDQAGQIRVLALAGGPVRTLLAGTQPEWGPDGYVYATTDSGTVRVPSTGGTVEVVSRLGEGEVQHIVRDVLPGGRRVLLEVARPDGGDEMRGLDLRSGETTYIGEGQLPRYVSTGHIVFLFGGTIMAARFAADEMALLGPPVAVQDDVEYFTLADDGKLYYTAGSGLTGAGVPVQLAWVQDGAEASPVDPAWTFDTGSDQWQSWSVSPDGTMIALRQFTDSGYDIWVKRLERGPLSRLTFDEGHEKMPVWRPGAGGAGRVTYLSDRGGNFDVWERAADGTGQAELILDLEEDIQTIRWSPDGAWLLLVTGAPNGDILTYRPGEDGMPTPLFATSFYEREPDVSPEGRWIAYTSDQSGRNEVYVTPFPDVDAGRWQVSIAGGRIPRWSPSGRALFFDEDGQGRPFMRVEVEDDAAFAPGTPEVHLESAGIGTLGSAQTSTVYDVGPDGRLLVGLAGGAAVSGDGGSSVPQRILVNNFFEELKRVVPR